MCCLYQCSNANTVDTSGGNKRFRDAVTSSLQQYMKSETRFEKSLVVHSIIDSIHQVGGRFLKKDFSTSRWYEMSRQQCKEKVGHAIRDAVNSYEARQKKKEKAIRDGYIGGGNSGITPEVLLSIDKMDHSGSSQKRRFSEIHSETPIVETDYSSSHRKRRRKAREEVITSMTASMPLKPSPIQPPHSGLVARMPPVQRSPIERHRPSRSAPPPQLASMPPQVFSFDRKAPPQQRDDFHHGSYLRGGHSPTADNFELAIDAVLGPMPSDVESPTNPSP